MNASPDYETKASYTIHAVAEDEAGNTASQTVTINVNDLDEVPPVFNLPTRGPATSTTIWRRAPTTTSFTSARPE